MKFTLSWLKDHLDTSASLEALTAKLSAVGLEVESVDDAGTRLAPFTIARVIAARPHPNADRLSCARSIRGRASSRSFAAQPTPRPG